MRSVSYYHKGTGEIHGKTVVASDDRAIELNKPSPEHIALDNPDSGLPFDPLSQRVDVSTGKIVDYQPPPPSADHEWQGTTRRWILNQATRERDENKRAARARIASLADGERHLIRQLVLNPSDAAARGALQAIDTEIAQLLSE